MGNGWDDREGRLLVPFDLKADVIEPLERLETGMADMIRRYDEHLTLGAHPRALPAVIYVEGLQRRAAERKVLHAKMKKIAIWSVSIVGPVTLAVVARVMGISV